MHYPEDTEAKENEATDVKHLVLDGTTSLDNPDDDVPRIKGLIELLNQYFGAKQS